MTTRPSWVEVVPRPDGLVTVDGDAAFVDALGATAPPMTIRGGDLRATLGIPRDAAPGDVVRRYEVDLLAVTLDDRLDRRAVAHVVATGPRHRGGWLAGPVVAVMNAEFVGPFDVSPRGHPADGRVEVIAVDDGLGLRARLQARRRLRTGTHLPHPAISTRSSRAGEWVFDRPMAVAVDGRRHRGVRTLRFEVLAAGAVVYF